MIHLIYNKDIPKNPNTADELILANLENALETRVQQLCHKFTNELNCELEYQTGKKLLDFVQIDNGGKMGFAQKAKKKSEGTKKGFPDIILAFGTPCGQHSQIICVEFKRIAASKSGIGIDESQLYYHDWLNSIGFKSYITNDPTFFRNVILQDVKDFFKKYLTTIKS
tara:strand:- start:33390 stop:33893 length:504 start_codon:yes stop_codon:yes gene_type:complete